MIRTTVSARPSRPSAFGLVAVGLVTLCLILGLGPATAPAAAQEAHSGITLSNGDVLRPLTAAERSRWEDQRRAALAGERSDRPVPEGRIVSRLDEDSRQYIVPRYEVEVGNPAGTTTAYAVRNTRSVTTEILVAYFDQLGNLDATESYTLDPFEVLTRNLRDVPGLTTVGGRKAGIIIITGPSTSLLSVDYFQVTPSQDFAVGDRGTDVVRTYLCDVWDIRFLQGGVFSGGTTLNLLFNSPQGNGVGDDPSVVIAISDEAGNPIDLLGFFTNRITADLAAADILDAVGPGAPPFGAFELTFPPDVDGGAVSAVYDADGRFSVGLKGTCLTR